MVTGNFKMALDSIRSAKWRSFLTMLGIIIGVVSVVTIVSIGEGIKKQITDQINYLGSDLVTIRPGKIESRDNGGYLPGVNFVNPLGTGSLSEKDLKTVQATPGVTATVPFSVVTGVPKADKKELKQAMILGTTEDLPRVLNQKIAYGEFFDSSDTTRPVAVIGQRVAEELFEESVPIGRSMQIRGENFVVLGVFEEFKNVALSTSLDYNGAIFIPFETGKRISGGQANIQQILTKPTDVEYTDSVVSALKQRLLTAHAGQDDFSVLQQADNLAIANTVLDLLTRLIAAVATVSLIVGGIGIMNVMLVAVTERTQEIGIRKAVGATNNQILNQFLIESAVISLVGGIVGVLVSLVANGIIRIVTDLEPVITLPIMGLAVVVALVVGIIFGVAPALKAASKDPITALRRM